MDRRAKENCDDLSRKLAEARERRHFDAMAKLEELRRSCISEDQVAKHFREWERAR